MKFLTHRMILNNWIDFRETHSHKKQTCDYVVRGTYTRNFLLECHRVDPRRKSPHWKFLEIHFSDARSGLRALSAILHAAFNARTHD